MTEAEEYKNWDTNVVRFLSEEYRDWIIDKIKHCPMGDSSLTIVELHKEDKNKEKISLAFPIENFEMSYVLEENVKFYKDPRKSGRFKARYLAEVNIDFKRYEIK